MATSLFTFAGTKVFSGKVGAAIKACRFVGQSSGKKIPCANGERPLGVSDRDYDNVDDTMHYHTGGSCSVETDGTNITVDAYLKAASDGSGKGTLDSSPGFATGARVLTYDSATKIAYCRINPF